MTSDDDVPLRVDFRFPEVARKWADEAEAKRPARPQIRDLIAAFATGRVLELGSGPGWLAERVLLGELATVEGARAVTEYVLLDFAEPMLAMARERIGASDVARYECRDFLDPGWTAGLGRFDAVVTMQAVHELRHKRRASTLYRQIVDILAPDGILVVCDHEPVLPKQPTAAGLTENEIHRLSSTVAEQHAAMRAAGFTNVTTELEVQDQYVISARQ